MYPHLYPADILPAKASRIADLGCGRGEWLEWLYSLGYEKLVGIDMAASELEKLSQSSQGQNIAWQEGEVSTVLKDPANIATFDLLHAKDLFEHFDKNEAVDFLQSAYHALRPNGELWIMTFNAQSPLSTATRYGDFTHENAITPNSLAQVLRATGFEIVSVKGFHPYPAGLKGLTRHLLFSFFAKTSQLLIKLRHGGGHSDGKVDSYSCATDVFAIAKKRKTRS